VAYVLALESRLGEDGGGWEGWPENMELTLEDW
jgi:hypothetical protein